MNRILGSAIALTTILLLLTACAPLQSLSDKFPSIQNPTSSGTVAATPDIKPPTTQMPPTQPLPTPKPSINTSTQTQGANIPAANSPRPRDTSMGSGGLDVDQLKSDMNAVQIQAAEDRAAGAKRREESLRLKAEMDAAWAGRIQDPVQAKQNACGSLLDTKNQAMAQLETINPATMCESYKNNSSQTDYNACLEKVINGKKQGEANLSALLKKFDYMNCK